MEVYSFGGLSVLYHVETFRSLTHFMIWDPFGGSLVWEPFGALLTSGPFEASLI